MEILHGLERAIGYILLIFTFPVFIGLYVLFDSHLVSSYFLHNFSGLLLLGTGNSFLAGLLSFSFLDNVLIISGLAAIGGAVLILFGSEEYSGLSKVGTEILILSVISLIFVIVVPNVIIPILVSNIGGSALSGINNTISTILSPIFSAMLYVDIFFVVFGAGLIALKYAMPYITKLLASKTKKKTAKIKPFLLYKAIGIPAGVAVMIILLVVVTVFNSALSTNSTTYHYTDVPSNGISQSYQNTNGTPAVLNLSDYYFFTGPNASTTLKGGITLSPSFEPLPFLLPMTFNITKVGDPIRLDIDINLSSFNGLIDSLVNLTKSGKSNNNLNNSLSNFTIPNNVLFTVLYNDSGIATCSNFGPGSSSKGSTLHCSYQPINVSLSDYFLNVNSSTEKRSLFGQLFGLLSLPATLLSSNSSNKTSTSSFMPTFTFVNNVQYNGNDCSLFNINGSYSYLSTTGQICISDLTGVPSFVDINEISSFGNNLGFELTINFATTSINQNVSLSSINYFPPGTEFNNGSQ